MNCQQKAISGNRPMLSLPWPLSRQTAFEFQHINGSKSLGKVHSILSDRSWRTPRTTMRLQVMRLPMRLTPRSILRPMAVGWGPPSRWRLGRRESAGALPKVIATGSGFNKTLRLVTRRDSPQSHRSSPIQSSHNGSDGPASWRSGRYRPTQATCQQTIGEPRTFRASHGCLGGSGRTGWNETPMSGMEISWQIKCEGNGRETRHHRKGGRVHFVPSTPWVSRTIWAAWAKSRKAHEPIH